MKKAMAVAAVVAFLSGCTTVNSSMRSGVSLSGVDQNLLVGSMSKAVKGLKLESFLRNNKAVVLEVTAGLADVGEAKEGQDKVSQPVNPALERDVRAILTLAYTEKGIRFVSRGEEASAKLTVHVLVHGLEESETSFFGLTSKSKLARTKLAATLGDGGRVLGMTLAEAVSGD
jgi:hypothetical protein